MAILKVETEGDIVTGLPAGNQGISVFKGIPYAKPLLGEWPWRSYSGRDFALSNQMCGYWTNFIKNGDPNGESLSAWPAFTDDSRFVMELNIDGSVRPLPKPELADFESDFFLGFPD